MKKYGFILRTSLIEKWQYKGNMFGRVAIYAVIIFMFVRLWSYMYRDGGTALGGYTLDQMIWYVIMTELIWFSARSQFIRKEIADDIKSGKIAYTLNKPYHYVFYILSKYLGETLVSYLLNIVAAVLIGLVLVGRLSTFSPVSVPFIAVTLLFSTWITAFVYLIIALVSFWFEENAPFIWIYEKLVLTLGIMFPVEIFPDWAQPLIKLTPIYTTIYAPAKVTVDFSMAKWQEITAMQLVYFAITLGLVLVVYGRGVKKLNVNGG